MSRLHLNLFWGQDDDGRGILIVGEQIAIELGFLFVEVGVNAGLQLFINQNSVESDFYPSEVLVEFLNTCDFHKDLTAYIESWENVDVIIGLNFARWNYQAPSLPL